MKDTAIKPTRAENYPEWYQQVVSAAELAETSSVRGCMVIRPWGYAIWEHLQREMDERFRATGHVNAYFPLLIPLNLLEKEAEHIEGFAKECAVVTHHRLSSDGKGGLKPDGELEEPYIIRPTSETIIGQSYAKWVESYRDLPILINQWANVMRWEMRTRLFLRTSEFLWQEGHTAHATSEEAVEETLKMLDVYQECVETVLAIPVIKGEKPVHERFPGAVNTYCIEAMMQDHKALQAGTSHFLGQNFSKAYDIKFLNKEGQIEYAWTTSWGTSTRLIGGLIMTHSDDNGLVLPPAVAAQQIVLLPIYKTEAERETVLNYCKDLLKELSGKSFNQQKIRAHIDDRDLRGGEKNWQWIKKGVPLRLEIGPRDVAKNSLMLSCRDQLESGKTSITRDECVAQAETLLSAMQRRLFEAARKRRDEHMVLIDTLEEFKAFFGAAEVDESVHAKGFALSYAVDDAQLESYLKPLKVTARCIPFNQSGEEGHCIFTGQKTHKKMIFAKAY